MQGNKQKEKEKECNTYDQGRRCSTLEDKNDKKSNDIKVEEDQNHAEKIEEDNEVTLGNYITNEMSMQLISTIIKQDECNNNVTEGVPRFMKEYYKLEGFTWYLELKVIKIEEYAAGLEVDTQRVLLKLTRAEIVKYLN